jgi:DNA processing protein
VSGDGAAHSADPALSVLAAAIPGSVRWPVAAGAAGGLPALARCSRGALLELGLDRTDCERLRNPDESRLSRWREWLAQPGHAIVTLGSPGYPPRLAELADAPIALWTIGPAPALLNGPQLAIVGSRQPTAGGIGIARRFAAAVGRAGITITSGLATGIDAAAHEGAADSVGRTIAILGCGIDHIYPAGNADLAARISQRGLIASEYPPGTPTRPHQFPERNRIIAGLSLGTLVVEAAARSGALITARLAGEYGRSVLAVPGSIRSTVSKGCHKLLRDGACLVEEARDILLELAPEVAATLSAQPDDETLDDVAIAQSDDETLDDVPTSPAGAGALLRTLDFVPVTVQELRSVTGLTAAELSSMLLHLEMEGKIEALPGGRYCRLV